MDDLISVIVPIYKIENYLNKCVNSILMQTYSNLEIILVDDGSPDQCGEMCDQLKKIDYRIRVIHKKNGGLSDARNAGIKTASGKYIVFIDGDDYIHQNYIQNLYEAITENAADVAVCSFALVGENHRIIKSERVSEGKSTITGRELLEKVLTSTGYKYVVAWNKLYKRDLFKAHQFDKGKLYEDEYINFELFWDVNKVVLIPDILYFYFQRKGSIQGSNLTWDKLMIKQELHHKRIAFYRNKGDYFLMKRAQQMYCNWIVNVSYQNRDLMNKEKIKILQNEFREYSKGTLALRGEKVQNLIAQINIELAGKIKAQYKSERNYKRNEFC